MRNLAFLLGGGILGAILAAACWSQERSAQRQSPPAGKRTQQDLPRELLAPVDFDSTHADLWKNLERKVTIDVQNVPLTKVCELLSKELGLRLVLEPDGLAEVGIKPQEPVSLRLADVPLRRGLKQLLRPLGLTWQIAEGGLVITSAALAERHGIVRLYPVADLVVFAAPAAEALEFADGELLDLIVTFVVPEIWEENGGPGAIGFSAITMALIAETSEEVHDEIESFLAGLRAARRRAATLAEHLGWPELPAIQAAYVANLAEEIWPPEDAAIDQGPDRGVIPIRAHGRAFPRAGRVSDQSRTVPNAFPRAGSVSDRKKQTSFRSKAAKNRHCSGAYNSGR